MTSVRSRRYLFIMCLLFISPLLLLAQQPPFKLKYKNSLIYAGIDVGSKGVKLSILEIGKNAQKTGAFNVLKDTSINTDFISFSQSSFDNTLNGLSSLYLFATRNAEIPSERVFVVISSGVKVSADREDKVNWIDNLVTAFKVKVHEPDKQVAVIDVLQEARLSHLGIVPESRRYTTFLIDIGSGNTKGGYFPNGNTKEMKLFQLTWGTKSISNATESRSAEDKTLANYNKQLSRVIAGAVNNEIIYAVNESGAYEMSDYIAFSGGIAWSVATLISPELVNSSVVPVTYEDVVKFSEKIYKNYTALSDNSIAGNVSGTPADKEAAAKEAKRVNQVFDQRALMAGTALLLKIMRQFEGIYEKKQFFLVKNGQVGWISAYVDQSINKSVSLNK